METAMNSSTVRSVQANAHHSDPDETTALLDSNSNTPNDQQEDVNADDKASLAFRIGAAMSSFFVLGLFYSSLGVILPPVAKYYSLSDLQVSKLFLVGPMAYVCAAQANSYIHFRLGQRGIAFIAPVLHIVAALAIAGHPRFELLLVAVALAYVGHGLLDGSWCSWTATMPQANRVSGFLHGSFSLGAAVGPVVASLIMDDGRRPWWVLYWAIVGASVLEWLVLVVAFRNQTASQYHVVDGKVAAENDSSKLLQALRHPALWTCAVFFLADVGTENAISGWIVSFMLRSRHASERLSNLSSSGYWAGQTVGRLFLGSATDRLGVRRATSIYFAATLLLQLAFALVQDAKISIVLASLMGFFMGPMFPSAVVVLTELLPTKLHVAAVSTTASIGQVGAATLPFGIGALIHSLGIGVLRYAIMVSMTVIFVFWIVLACLKTRSRTRTACSHTEAAAG